jgi:hypothetical protein
LIAQVDLDDGVHSYTVVESSYDTTDTGHIMNRFRSIDSLMDFTGDSVDVTITVYNVIPGTLLVYFTSAGGVTRRSLINQGSGNSSQTRALALGGAGITNLYFEALATEVLYYVVPRKDYSSNVWLIPVNSGGAR